MPNDPSEKRRCPITGKPLPPKVTPPDHEMLAMQLAELRREWARMGNNRYGRDGDSAMRRYRKMAREYWGLTGKHPPPIYNDL